MGSIFPRWWPNIGVGKLNSKSTCKGMGCHTTIDIVYVSHMMTKIGFDATLTTMNSRGASMNISVITFVDIRSWDSISKKTCNSNVVQAYYCYVSNCLIFFSLWYWLPGWGETLKGKYQFLKRNTQVDEHPVVRQ